MPEKNPEEIAIIGGGLAGCLVALMLAKNPRYHVTLIEKQPTVLNGASLIASRLHQGREYPLDPATQRDCLENAVVWKLLMPDNIYTPVPPMKFLVANETQQYGKAHPEAPQSLTLDKFFSASEDIRQHYEEIFGAVKRRYGWEDATIEKKLFGSYAPGQFSRLLAPEEYADYPGVVGGIQSQEMGLNVPKYLTMIEEQLREEQKKGNIRILTSHMARSDIKGKLGAFEISCWSVMEGKDKIIEADQVINAAHSDGPAIVPQMGKAHSHNIQMVVYRRAMLFIRKLPEKWKTPPAFIMKDEHGGMLSCFNDETAVCYRPTDEAAYWKGEWTLTAKDPHLPPHWDAPLSSKEEKEWKENYLKSLQARFPILKDVKPEDTQLVVRNTVALQKNALERRPNLHAPQEVSSRISLKQVQTIAQTMDQQEERGPLVETKKGLFTFYPTKATYCVGSALQAAVMVETRSLYPHSEDLLRLTPLVSLFLGNNLEKYSLRDMPRPTPAGLQEFLRQHKLPYNILKETWMDTFGKNTDASWGDRVVESRKPTKDRYFISQACFLLIDSLCWAGFIS